MTAPIPAHIASLWRNHDKIAAIKRLREETGMGLAEAKHALETQLDGGDDSASSAGSLGVSAAIDAALARGDKIVAIKLLKDATGMGLKEAKDRIESGDPQQWRVEGNLAQHPATPPAVRPAAPNWAAAGHEPGKVQGSGTWTAVFAIVLVLVLASWYFLRA